MTTSNAPNSSQSSTSCGAQWHVKLRQILIDYFDESELETLCFDLRVDYDSLAGTAKATKAIALIEHLVHLGRVVELIDYCSQLRPNIPWSDLRSAAISNPLIDSSAPQREQAGASADRRPKKRAGAAVVPARPYLLALSGVVVVLVAIIGFLVINPPHDSDTTPSPTPTVTRTPAPTRRPTDTPTPTAEPIPTPELVLLSGTENYEANGKSWVRYRLNVTNWRAFPPELFQSAPDLPPCGSNTEASRTWVDIYDAADGTKIYGFCGLSSPKDLNGLWFAVEQGTVPPAAVYVELIDRRESLIYRSNAVPVR